MNEEKNLPAVDPPCDTNSFLKGFVTLFHFIFFTQMFPGKNDKHQLLKNRG